MSGTTELIAAYGIMSAIIVFYEHHRELYFCPLKSVNFPPPSKRNSPTRIVAIGNPSNCEHGRV